MVDTTPVNLSLCSSFFHIKWFIRYVCIVSEKQNINCYYKKPTKDFFSISFYNNSHCLPISREKFDFSQSGRCFFIFSPVRNWIWRCKQNKGLSFRFPTVSQTFSRLACCNLISDISLLPERRWTLWIFYVRFHVDFKNPLLAKRACNVVMC